jgi:hypothetical protein
VARRFPEFDKPLLENGFKVDFVDDETVIYVKTLDDIKLDVQLWEDGRHRITHSYRGTSNTFPTSFSTPESMMLAISYESARRMIRADRNIYHAFDDAAQAYVDEYYKLHPERLLGDRTRCKWCYEYSAPDTMEECPHCWELRTRIHSNFTIALRILNALEVSFLEQGHFSEDLTRLKEKIIHIDERREAVKEAKDTV